MRRALLIMAALGLLGGCDEAPASFSETFDKDFRLSCVSSAYSKGVEEPVGKEICDCALGKINRQFSAAQKLSAQDEQLRPIINECVKSVVQNNG
jgi:hypothetical protein